jgi:ABC-type polysaccharide/polyol phosphate export permease/Flp pilus assembly protein TadD
MTSPPDHRDFRYALNLLEKGSLGRAEIEALSAEAAHARNWSYAAAFTRYLLEIEPSARKHRELSGYLTQLSGAQAGLADAIAASKLDPECSEYAIHAAGLLNASSRFEEATKFLQRALELDPQSAILYRHLSWTMEQRGQLDEAAILALRAYELDPSNVEASLAMSHLLRRLGRTGDAIKVLRLVSSSGVQSASLRRTLSGYLAEFGDFAAALREIGLAIRKSPEEPEFYIHFASLFLRIGRIGDAIEVLQEAKARGLTSPPLLRTLSGCLAEAGDPKAALAEIDLALDGGEETAEYYIHRSGLLLSLGRHDEAQASITRAIEIEPSNLAAKRQKITIALEAEDFETALAIATELLRDAPGEQEYERYMMHVLQRKLDSSAAIPDILQRKRQAPPRRPREAESWAKSLESHVRVISALFLREMRTRYGHSRFGYFWAIVEPSIHIGALAVIFQFLMNGQPPIGDSYFFFYFTGLIPYLLFVHTSEQVGRAIEQNRPLLMLPMVTNLRCITARGLLELFTVVVVSLTFILGFRFFGVDAIPHDLPAALTAIGLVWAIGMGFGIISAVAGIFISAWHYTFQVLLRFLYFCSGIFYAPGAMPESVRDILAWNPLLHCIDLFRISFFPAYAPSWLSSSYAGISALAVLFFGLLIEGAFRGKILKTS